MRRNDFFQFSIDNVAEIVITFDKTGVIEYANATANAQLDYEGGLIGRRICEVFSGKSADESCISGLVAEVDQGPTDYMFYRGNRTCFPARVRLFVCPGCESEEEKQYLCMATNISGFNQLKKEITQANHEAEEAQKVKMEFVANVTHELRTPVNGILGNTKELLELETDKEKKKLLRLVERGCSDMNAIINNILDFSKLEADKFTLEPRKFNFRSMIDYIRFNHSNRITEKGLEFSILLSSDIPEFVVGDELRIVQILNNLISNAYKFTSVGEIHLEVVKTAQLGKRIELFFMVIDSGIGIDKSNMDKLFRSFSQVDASISRKYGGTGLGLNICKQLVELMGGNIHVNSERGKGSIFSFNIWVEAPEEVSKEVKEEKQSADIFSEQTLLKKLQSLTESSGGEGVWKYGEQKNKDEIDKKMSRLVLCVEMENWEKAETFANTIKSLVDDAPKEVKSAALRLKMSVQRADYQKTMDAIETLQKAVEETYDTME